MRVAGHTYALRDRPLEDALEALAGIGFERAEVWLGHAAEGPAAAADALAGAGMAAAAVSAGGFYVPGSDVPQRAAALAEAVRAPVIVMCVAPPLASTLAARVPAHLEICVENHWDQPVARPDEVLAVLGREPRLRACLDTGHSLLAGVRPERFATRLGSRLRHVHLKDARPPAPPVRLLGRKLRRRLLQRPSPVAPGEGALDVASLRGALAAVGFAGTVTLEHEGVEPEAALRRLLHEWESAAAAAQEL